MRPCIPGAFILVAVLSLNFLGDGLRDSRTSAIMGHT